VVLLWLWTVSTVTAQTRQQIHVGGVPGYQTLKCDFHMHTVFSDGSVWPTVRVEEAWRDGLDAIAITDHIEYQPHKDDIPTKHNRPFEIAAGRARELGLLFLRGAEITRETPPGHFNGIFLKDVEPLNVKDFFEVFQRANEQEAFVFWNHPGWQGPERGRWGDAQTKLLEKGWMHGIEICNGETYYADAHQWAVQKNLTIVGNSDSHGPIANCGWTAENHRTITLVFAKAKTLDALHEALRAGRTAVWCKNQLYGRESFLSAIFKRSVRVGPPHHRTNDALFVEIRNGSDISIALEKAGKFGPDRITLAPHTSSLAVFRTAADGNRDFTYRVANFLTAPNQPLTVTLTIPELTESLPAVREEAPQ